MRFQLFPAAVLGAGLASHVPTAACAQEIASDDREIIVTGSKSPFGVKSGIPIAQIPQGVQVLNSEDFAARDVRSIGDALRAVPSANVGAPRTAAYQSFSIRVRGFLADQLRNGVRQRYYEDVDASSLTNIDRIEVLKGPSSVLYGQSALGGLISIVTKEPERDFSATLSAVGGTNARAAGSFDLTGPVTDTLALRFNGEIERSGTFVELQDLNRENFAFSALWTPHARVDAHLVAEWNRRATLRNPGLPVVGALVANGIEPLPRSRFLGEPASTLSARAPLVQAWVNIRLAKEWTLTPRVSYSGFETDFTQLRVLDVEADGVTVRRNGRFGSEDDRYTIAQLDLNGAFSTGPLRHHLLLGVEGDFEQSTFNQENILDADGNNITPSINALDPQYGLLPQRPFAFGFVFDSAINGAAVYLQDRIDITPRLNVILAARWSSFDTSTGFSADPGLEPGDFTDDRFDHVTWQAGVTYRLGGGFSLFGGYATGFDLENITGSRGADGRPLAPEESQQGEAGVRFASTRLRTSLSGFDVRRTNLATGDVLNPGFSIQTGAVRVRGFEAEGEFEPVSGLRLQGGYAFLASRITSSNNGDEGDDLADTPRHQANLALRWTVPGTRLELRGGANYVGGRRFSNARQEVFPGLLASDVRLPDYVLLDLGAGYAFKRYRFDVTLTNAANARFFTTEGAFNAFAVFPGEPLQASFRVSRTFGGGA